MGGMCLAIAATFERAVELLLAEDNTEKFYRTAEETNSFSQWYLKESFDLAGSPEESTLINCNWS